MLTVDFDRLGLRPGDRVLDMGCGGGRHAFEMYRRGADVVAFDQDGDELAGVLDLFGAMREAGEVPSGAEADIKQGDARSLPFPDGEFDRVVAACTRRTGGSSVRWASTMTGTRWSGPTTGCWSGTSSAGPS
jgi:ubiquinone/menaquinone biosynthesis C-methylase UbiE